MGKSRRSEDSIHVGNNDTLNELERKRRNHRRRFDSLSGGTKPRTDTGRVGRALMVGMMLGVTDAGHSHEAVHQQDAQ